MNSRRSRPKRMQVENLEILETRREKPAFADSSSTVFCCVAASTSARDKKIAYSYSHTKKDNEMRALAALCLEHTPMHHRWYCHTVGTRTFGYLMADGRTYFAIVDPSPGTPETVRFLEHVRNVYNTVPKKHLDDALAPVVRQVVATLENVPRTNSVASAVFHGVKPRHEGSPHEQILATPVVSAISGNRDEEAQHVGPNDRSAPLNGRGSPLARRQLHGRSLCQRHAMIVIAVDVVLCLILFAVWVGVCHGFKCVSRQ